MPHEESLEDRLRSLGFQGNGAMKLIVGHVTIAGGASLRGFSLTFTEVGPRSAKQYQTHGPASTTTQMIAGLIRANLELNHSTSVPEWDLLQQNLEQSRQAQ